MGKLRRKSWRGGAGAVRNYRTRLEAAHANENAVRDPEESMSEAETIYMHPHGHLDGDRAIPAAQARRLNLVSVFFTAGADESAVEFVTGD